jgi:uncharacterized protein (DUF697 family)
MATKRTTTIGSNPLKSTKAAKAEKVKNVDKTATLPVAEAKILSTQSPEVKKRVRRTNKETEALFAEQLKADAPSAAAKVEPTQEADVYTSDRHQEAMAIVKTWSQWAVVAGLTPVPILDTLALSGAQIKLIQLLCKHYEVPFEQKVAIAVAAGLIGGTATSAIATGMTRILMKNIPIAGQIFNLTVEPALSYGSTYAIGASFVKHFESRGNLSNFKSDQMQDYSTEQYKKGKKMFFSKKSAVPA